MFENFLYFLQKLYFWNGVLIVYYLSCVSSLPLRIVWLINHKNLLARTLFVNYFDFQGSASRDATMAIVVPPPAKQSHSNEYPVDLTSLLKGLVVAWHMTNKTYWNLGPVQTWNLSCVESNTYLGRPKFNVDSDVELNVKNGITFHLCIYLIWNNLCIRFGTWKIRRLNQLNSTNLIWVDPSIKFDRSGWI